MTGGGGFVAMAPVSTRRVYIVVDNGRKTVVANGNENGACEYPELSHYDKVK